MKKTKPNSRNYETQKKVSLIPSLILIPLWYISLGIPNIIYSGVNFADTLHILKWTVTGVPIAVAVLIAGIRMFFYDHERLEIKIDIFALIWALILIYCALQPLWVKISSPTGYSLEMVCFITVWAFYVITVSAFPNKALRPILIIANINAAVNTLFAELQLRRINDLKFLEGTIFEGLQKYSAIILPTPGNYIGNTAQNNMYALWIALSILSAIYMFVFDFPEIKNGRIRKPLSFFILILCAVNFWGLMTSISRSSIIGFAFAFILMLLIGFWKFGSVDLLKRFGIVILILVSVFWLSRNYSLRSEGLTDRIIEIVEETETVAGRRGIWTTSFAMAKEHPLGVGIGQYKWHYIEAQREGFKLFNHDWYTWQYTHWAHNEFLQFFCEGGIIGGIMFVLMFLIGFFAALIGLFRKKNLDRHVVWAMCIVFFITFTALFTRPFHRIENIVWLVLAFAISNRKFLPEFSFSTDFDILPTNGMRKLIGTACIAASVAGCIYISSGIYGNYVLRKALATSNASLQIYLLQEAEKHPIVREEAKRNIGYHYISLGEQTEDMQAVSQGFQILWEHFNREPHSEDIGKILNMSQRYQIEGALREIVSYFKPGTYHLERRPQKDSSGKIVSALLLADGPGDDDD